MYHKKPERSATLRKRQVVPDIPRRLRYAPIVEAMNAVLDGRLEPAQAIHNMMTRPVRNELIFDPALFPTGRRSSAADPTIARSRSFMASAPEAAAIADSAEESSSRPNVEQPLEEEEAGDGAPRSYPGLLG